MLVTLATLFAVAGLSNAQAGWSCDSLIQPNWDDCDVIANQIPWSDLPGGKYDVRPQVCQSFFTSGQTGNCIINLCNNRPIGSESMPMNSFTEGSYFLIKNACEPVNAGGETNPFDGAQKVRVVNNPDLQPPSRIKRAMSTDLRSSSISIEESDNIYEEAKQGTIVNRLKSRSPQLNKNTKRQDKWTNVAIYRNVRKPYESTRMSAIAGSGASQSWSVTEGYSTSVTTSVEVGASFLEVFSASVSISVTFEQSVSYTETYSFDPSGKCKPEQSAVLYFHPLFNQYQGYRGDDQMNFIDVWVPIEGKNNYEMEVTCLG